MHIQIKFMHTLLVGLFSLSRRGEEDFGAQEPSRDSRSTHLPLNCASTKQFALILADNHQSNGNLTQWEFVRPVFNDLLAFFYKLHFPVPPCQPTRQIQECDAPMLVDNK